MDNESILFITIPSLNLIFEKLHSFLIFINHINFGYHLELPGAIP